MDMHLASLHPPRARHPVPNTPCLCPKLVAAADHPVVPPRANAICHQGPGSWIIAQLSARNWDPQFKLWDLGQVPAWLGGTELGLSLTAPLVCAVGWQLSPPLPQLGLTPHWVPGGSLDPEEASGVLGQGPTYPSHAPNHQHSETRGLPLSSGLGREQPPKSASCRALLPGKQTEPPHDTSWWARGMCVALGAQTGRHKEPLLPG